MGVRPPPADDTGGGPEAVDFGIAAMDATLDDADVTFPVSRDELRNALGDAEIAYDPHGNTVTFAKVLDQVQTSEFESERELLDALHPVFERYRKSSRPGFVQWMLNKLPF